MQKSTNYKLSQNRRLFCHAILLLVIVYSFACHENGLSPQKGSRQFLTITWDNSGKQISHNIYFAEYGRVRRWHDDTLLFIYHCGPKGNEWDNVVMRRSFDNGSTWSAFETIVADDQPQAYSGFCTPDLIKLQNGWLLLAYTGRGNPDDTLHNNIQVRVSKDIGHSWTKPVIMAIGRSWEPGIVQLPGGEVQIFFSNELISSKRSKGRPEQKILMCSSVDNGAHWQSPVQIAFIKGVRAGMPVPLLLKNNKDVIMAMESVNLGDSPCILASSIENNWQTWSRSCGLRGIWGGAPYMIKLPTGEVILSVQDAGGRKVKRYTQWKKNTMFILVGDSTGRNFGNASCAWPDMPVTEGAYFSSLFLKNDSTIVAISTRNHKDGHSDIWWKEGHIRRRAL
jgi:hypothetical protein